MSSAASLYSSVISDVISSIRESFLDEAVDEQVLQELKTLWEQKLSQSKTVDPNNRGQEALLDAKMAAGRSAGIDIDSKSHLTLESSDFKDIKVSEHLYGKNQFVAATPQKIELNPNMVATVQVNLPPRPHQHLPGALSEPRAIMIIVPAHALQSSGPASALLQQVVTQAINQALIFPTNEAQAFLQNQINTAFGMNLC